MIRPVFSPSTLLACTTFAMVGGVVGCASSSGSTDDGGRIVQPGAPGQPSRILSDPDSAQVRVPGHTEHDIAFMRGMIDHHTQAIVMSRLVPERTMTETVVGMARRIERSQLDEIALIGRWLGSRGEPVPSPAADASAFPTGPAHGHGMLTRAEFETLSGTRGEDFDRAFLGLMIRHHEGALTMVRELFQEGGGQEPAISQLANEINMDQSVEISRMVRMLEGAR